jgi:hypothetical protein
MFPKRREFGKRSDFGGRYNLAPFSGLPETDSDQRTRLLMAAAPLPRTGIV